MPTLSRSTLNAFRATSLATLAVFGACAALEPRQPETLYDLVILHGRVMDPATGLDGIRALGITGGVIREVSEEDLRGAKAKLYQVVQDALFKAGIDLFPYLRISTQAELDESPG